MRDLFKGALYKISAQDHQMRHLYTRSPDIPGPPRSLHRSSLQHIFTRPLWEISIQELSTRSLHGDPNMRHLYTRSPDIPGPPRSLHRSSLQDLLLRPLWEISTRSPDIPGPLRSPHRSSLQDLFKRRRSRSNTQNTERVAWTKSKAAPRYRESDPTRANSAEGCTNASDIPSAKWTRRYSQSDPTRTKSREGCVCKHEIRDSKNCSSDRTLTSASQYEMRFLMFCDTEYCACHEKMNPRHTKSCNCHAKWCQHSRSKYDASSNKRAFRALQDRLQEHEILHLPQEMYIFHDLRFRATLTTILHASQNPHVLHISRFPKIDTARRRERASEMDLVKTPFRAGEMQIHDLEGNFHREGRQICRTRMRTPPIYTRCFSITVRTP